MQHTAGARHSPHQSSMRLWLGAMWHEVRPIAAVAVAIAAVVAVCAVSLSSIVDGRIRRAERAFLDSGAELVDRTSRLCGSSINIVPSGDNSSGSVRPLLSVVVPVKPSELLDQERILAVADKFTTPPLAHRTAGPHAVEIVFAMAAQNMEYTTPRDEASLMNVQLRRMRFQQLMHKMGRVQEEMCRMAQRSGRVSRQISLRIVPTMDFTSHRVAASASAAPVVAPEEANVGDEKEMERHRRRTCFAEFHNLYRMSNHVVRYTSGEYLLFLPSIGEMEALHVDMGRLMALVGQADDNYDNDGDDDDDGSGRRTRSSNSRDTVLGHNAILGGTVLTRLEHIPFLTSTAGRQEHVDNGTQQYEVLAAGLTIDNNGTAGYHVPFPRKRGLRVPQPGAPSQPIVDVDAVPLETMLISRKLFVDRLRMFSTGLQDVACKEEVDHSVFSAVDLSMRARIAGATVKVSNVVSVALNPHARMSLARMMDKLTAVQLSQHLGMHPHRTIREETLKITDHMFRNRKYKRDKDYTVEQPLELLQKRVGHVMDEILAARPRELGTDCTLLFRFPEFMYPDSASAMLKVLQKVGDDHHRETLIVRHGDEDSITRSALVRVSKSAVNSVSRMMVPAEDAVTHRRRLQRCVFVQLATPAVPTIHSNDTSVDLARQCYRVLFIVTSGNKTEGIRDREAWLRYMSAGRFHQIWYTPSSPTTTNNSSSGILQQQVQDMVHKDGHANIHMVQLPDETATPEIDSLYESAARTMLSILKRCGACNGSSAPPLPLLSLK